MRQALAKEIVNNLFHSPNRFSVLSSDEEASLPEWTCKGGGIFNFATRKVCRRCGEKVGASGGSRGLGPASPPSGRKGTPPEAKTERATKGPTQGKGVGKGKSAWGKGDGYPKEADGNPMGNTEGQNRGDPWKRQKRGGTSSPST
jgi:hypothetical protein